MASVPMLLAARKRWPAASETSRSGRGAASTAPKPRRGDWAATFRQMIGECGVTIPGFAAGVSAYQDHQEYQARCLAGR